MKGLKSGGIKTMSIDLGFEAEVPPDGYRWWYVDGLSDDGQHSLTAIAFIGSVFSPYYFAARQNGPADPRDHICLNVVLTGQRPNRWCFTEFNRTSLTQRSDTLGIGASTLVWADGSLTITVNEDSCPWPRPVRGQITVRPEALTGDRYDLDQDGRHIWRPIAPLSRIEVVFTEPHLSWTGEAYFDSNWGSRPLEDDFYGWTWSQAGAASGKRLFYDLQRRDGSSLELALEAHTDGSISKIDAPPLQKLDRGFWGIQRELRSEDASVTRVTDTMLDAPFYARSAVQSRINGATVAGTHESLSLDLFRSWWVQRMLPFRSRRG